MLRSKKPHNLSSCYQTGMIMTGDERRGEERRGNMKENKT